MIRRLPTDRPVRVADSDAEMLRVSASAANEAVDVMTLQPSNRVGAGFNNVAQRYGRALSITAKDIADGLHVARSSLRDGPSSPVPRAPAREDVPQGDPGTTEFSALLASRSSR